MTSPRYYKYYIKSNVLTNPLLIVTILIVILNEQYKGIKHELSRYKENL